MGDDNTLMPTSYPTKPCGTDASPFNSNELEVFNCSQDSVNPSTGLTLTCQYEKGVGGSAHPSQNYNCGAATSRATAPRGYKFFQWNVASGAEWAFQTTVQWPPNTGEADPTFWSPNDGSTEIDFFEGFGREGGAGSGWCNRTGGNGNLLTAIPDVVGSSTGEVNVCKDNVFDFDPSAALHTYTTVLYPNDTLAEYIDGKRLAWTRVLSGGSSTLLGPAKITSGKRGLELDYAMRDQSDCPSTPADCNPDPYFTSGSRRMIFRSVAVYENASAKGAGTTNAQVAPGTAVK